MALDRKLAEGALVDVLDALNGNRIVGTGFRVVEGAIATACQCLPRPTGRALLPDPDAPGTPVLVRVCRPGDSGAPAFAAVAAADPYSKLALLRTTTAGGLAVPDELNPAIAIGTILEELAPTVPELSPRDGPVFVPARGQGWLEGDARRSTIAWKDGSARIGNDVLGAPVFNESGRVVGVLTAVDEARPGAAMCLLADHLPGWALRRAQDLA